MPLEAARWSRRAAEWAGFSDPTEALRHWRRVRTFAAAAPESSEATELVLAACVWILRFGWRIGLAAGEASAVFDEGKRLAERNGDLRSLARLHSAHGFVTAEMLGPPGQVLPLIEEGRRLAREIGDAAFALRLAPDWSITLVSVGRLDEALQIAEEIPEQARNDPKVGSDIVRSRAYAFLLCTKGVAHRHLGRLGESARVVEEARRLSRERGWTELLFFSEIEIASTAIEAGDAVGGLRHSRAAVELADRLGGGEIVLRSYLSLARAETLDRRWDAARESFEKCSTMASRRHYALAMVYLADACLGQGDHERARAAIEEGRLPKRGRNS